jgi:DNA transformation protein
MKEDSFKEFLLDQLGNIGQVSCRMMFGGYGFYCGGIFFGILYQGRLYFKTGPNTISSYSKRQMKPFNPNPKMTLKSYYEVPYDILEDPDQLVVSARLAIQSQKESKKR